MKKTLFTILLILCSITVSQAMTYNVSYPNTTDVTTIFSASAWDGVDHAIITYNRAANTAMATILDANGNPSNWNGFAYFFADLYLHSYDLYGSNDGINWILIKTTYY